MTGMEKLTNAVLRLADGTELPVTTHTFDHVPFGSSLTIENTAALHGGTLQFEAGFKAQLAPESTETFRQLAAGAPVDETLDDEFDDWRCPGCGKTWDEIPVGHSWALGFDPKTLKASGYTCSDPAPSGGLSALPDSLLEDLADPIRLVPAITPIRDRGRTP